MAKRSQPQRPDRSTAARRRAASTAPLGAGFAHAIRAFVATVDGREPATRRHYSAALATGESRVRLLEVARMAHLFCGFPRAIQGLRQLETALAEIASSRRSIPPKAPARVASRTRVADRARGRALFRKIYGAASDAVIVRLDAVAADYSNWVLEDAYGRVLTRAGLEGRERELLAVAALAALDCPAQLKSHLRGARRLGATRSQLAAALAALTHEVPAQRLTRATQELASSS